MAQHEGPPWHGTDWREITVVLWASGTAGTDRDYRNCTGTGGSRWLTVAPWHRYALDRQGPRVGAQWDTGTRALAHAAVGRTWIGRRGQPGTALRRGRGHGGTAALALTGGDTTPGNGTVLGDTCARARGTGWVMAHRGHCKHSACAGALHWGPRGPGTQGARHSPPGG